MNRCSFKIWKTICVDYSIPLIETVVRLEHSGVLIGNSIIDKLKTKPLSSKVSQIHLIKIGLLDLQKRYGVSIFTPTSIISEKMEPYGLSKCDLYTIFQLLKSDSLESGDHCYKFVTDYVESINNSLSNSKSNIIYYTIKERKEVTIIDDENDLLKMVLPMQLVFALGE